MATPAHKLTPILRCELVSPVTLMHDFAKIRNILAGQAHGMTLDHELVDQVTTLLLVKIYDEQITPASKPTGFQVLPGENPSALAGRIEALFKSLRSAAGFGSLFSNGYSIKIGPELLAQVVSILQTFELSSARRDAVGEAFESFIGPGLRGDEGQFFTPRNVVELMVGMLDPKQGELIVDPACGSGGFLTQVAKSSIKGKSLTVVGIEKDAFLARIAAAQLELLSAETSVFCANSLTALSDWNESMRRTLPPCAADVVLTNPPFGSKISVGGNVLLQYHLAHLWKRTDAGWSITNAFVDARPPQILFVERCLELLKPGGRMGIVLPDGILGNVSEGYVRAYLQSVADVVAIVDCPLETFLPSTSTKTSLLFLRKKDGRTVQKYIFMAVPKKCGHDRRGKPLKRASGELDDDFPGVLEEFKNWRKAHARDF